MGISNINLNLSAADSDKLHHVISFLLDNEQYGDDWDEEIDLLKNIVSEIDGNVLIG